jgi:hypothetical protein
VRLDDDPVVTCFDPDLGAVLMANERGLRLQVTGQECRLRPRLQLGGLLAG